MASVPTTSACINRASSPTAAAIRFRTVRGMPAPKPSKVTTSHQRVAVGDSRRNFGGEEEVRVHQAPPRSHNSVFRVEVSRLRSPLNGSRTLGHHPLMLLVDLTGRCRSRSLHVERAFHSLKSRGDRIAAVEPSAGHGALDEITDGPRW
jgi:hypothetical protein